MKKKSLLSDGYFFNTISDIKNIYIQLDTDNKRHAQLQTDTLKNILQSRLEMQKEKLEEQNSQNNIIIFQAAAKKEVI